MEKRVVASGGSFGYAGAVGFWMGDNPTQMG